MYILKVQGLLWASKHDGTMKKGPNDASGIFWVQVSFIYFKLCFFYILTYILLYNQVETRDREGSDDENGPK